MANGVDTSDPDGHAGPAGISSAAPPHRRKWRSILLALGTLVSVTIALASNLDWFGWVGEIISSVGWRALPFAAAMACFSRSRPWLALINLTAAAAVLAPALFLSPRAPSVPATPHATVRLVIANGRTAGGTPDELFRLFSHADADVLILLEPPRAVLQALLPGGTWRMEFPFVVRAAPERGRHNWIIIASRLPIIEEPASGPGVKPVVLQAGDARVAFIATQLLSPRTPARRRIAQDQAREVATLADAFNQRKIPLVIAGDLNAAPSGHLSRRLAQATGTLRAKPRWRGGGSWPSWLNPWIAFPIDDALVSQHFTVSDWGLLVQPESDHRAVRILLAYPPVSADGAGIPPPQHHPDR